MPLSHFLMLLLVCGFALDFRRIEQANVPFLQELCLLLAVIGGLGLIVWRLMNRDSRIRVVPDGGRLVLLGGVIFAAWAPIAVLAGTSSSHPEFFSVFLPYGIYAMTLLATVCAINAGYRPRRAVTLLLLLTLVSSIWRVFYAVSFGGIALSEARWQILSPTVQLLVAASAVGLVQTNRRLLPLAALALFFFVVLLSVTRIYLVSVVAIGAITLFLASKGALPGGVLRRLVAPLALIGGGLIAFAVVVMLALPEIGDRWIGRLTGEKSDSGQNITLIVRIAEYKGQFDAFTATPLTMLVGKGFGSGYEWDQDYLTSLLEFTVSDEQTNSTRGSHSTWVYPTYAHGIVIGPWFLLSLVMAFFIALRRAKNRDSDAETRYVDFFVLYGLVACYGISFTSNLINERLGGVMMGVLVGLAIAARPAARPSAETMQTSSVARPLLISGPMTP